MNKPTTRTTIRTKSGKEYTGLLAPQEFESLLVDNRLQKWCKLPTINGETILFLDAIESAEPDPYSANLALSKTR